jgi:L-fucose isomerase-like protein
MHRTVPVAASLHDAAAVQATIDGVSRELARRGVAHEMREAGPDRPDASLMVTGGTEHLFESDLDVGIAGRLVERPATIARIGGRDRRSLFAANARVTRCGDHPSRCRTQVEVKVDAPLAGLLTSALGNHHALSPGHSAEIVREYHNLFVARSPEASLARRGTFHPRRPGSPRQRSPAPGRP